MLRSSDKMPILATSKLRLLLTAGLILSSAQASAESLSEALSAAYRNNPTLEANRSRVRAVDEDVSIANAGFRPRIAANGSLTWEHTIVSGNAAGAAVSATGNLTNGGTNRQATYGVGLAMPVFTGLQLTNKVRIAEANVRAAREDLRDTERNILLQAVIAYTRVVSSQEIVRTQEQSLSRLEQEVRIAKERVALTELTNTDLSQAKLRRANAVTQVATARADHKSARAAYLNAIGHDPGSLQDPKLPSGMPKSLAEAQAIAVRDNPLIAASLYGEESARHAIDHIRGRLLPQVEVVAGWGDEYNTSQVPYQNSALVQARVTLPLYEGGEVHAQVRQAKQMHLSQLQSIEAARSFVQQSVSTAWSTLEATRTRVELGQAQVSNSQVALDGVRKEETIGQRTLLDVLNAEQDILNARVSLIVARRDLVIASYDVLSQIGHLEAERLSIASLIYDPTIHYEEVRRKWFGLSISYADGRQEHLAAHDARDDRVTMK